MYKEGVGTDTYTPGRPHLVATAGAGGYQHDAVGNQTRRPNEQVTYTPYRKVREITRLDTGRKVGRSSVEPDPC
jgi:hypothetical protein